MSVTKPTQGQHGWNTILDTALDNLDVRVDGAQATADAAESPAGAQTKATAAQTAAASDATGKVVAHAAAADPHPAYLTEAAASGTYALVDSGVLKVNGAPVPDSALPATLARDAEIAAAYAPTSRATIGNAIVALGDSQTTASLRYNRTAIIEVYGTAWPCVLGWVSKQRVRVVRNAGVAGNTSAQMLARFDTDVTPFAPSAVTILAGANDVAQTVPLATFKANIAALVAKCIAIGAVPILATILPHSPAATYGTVISAWNAWLRSYALASRFPILDFNSILTDPATGNLAAAYDDGDGLHVNALGNLAMGTYASTVLTPQSREWSPPLPVSNVDPSNLLPNALFLTDTAPTDGRADGWVAYGGSQTNTLEAGTGSVVGNWQKCVAAAAGQGYTRSVTTGFAVGDKMALVGRFDTDTGATLLVQLLATGSAGYFCRPVNLSGEVVRDGVFYGELIVPAATTALEARLTAGIGTHKFAQVGLYNLTALGL